jgi:hypothetical protein
LKNCFTCFSNASSRTTELHQQEGATDPVSDEGQLDICDNELFAENRATVENQGAHNNPTYEGDVEDDDIELQVMGNTKREETVTEVHIDKGCSNEDETEQPRTATLMHTQEETSAVSSCDGQSNVYDKPLFTAGHQGEYNNPSFQNDVDDDGTRLEDIGRSNSKETVLDVDEKRHEDELYLQEANAPSASNDGQSDTCDKEKKKASAGNRGGYDNQSYQDDTNDNGTVLQ